MKERTQFLLSRLELGGIGFGFCWRFAGEATEFGGVFAGNELGFGMEAGFEGLGNSGGLAFGGAWVVCPDPVDFLHYGLVNIYSDDSAFVVAEDRQLQSPVGEWFHPERPMNRGVEGQPFLSMRQQSQMEDALGVWDREPEPERFGIDAFVVAVAA